MNIPKHSHNSCNVVYKPKTNWKRISGYVTMSVLGVFGFPNSVDKAMVQNKVSPMILEKPIHTKPPRRDPVFDASLGRIVAIQSGLDETLQNVDTVELSEEYAFITEQDKDGWRQFVGKLDLFSENPHFVNTLQRIFEQESHFDPNATSDTGAIGIAQLTGDVFADMRASHRGVRYFRLLRSIQKENSEILQVLPSDFRILIEQMPEKIRHQDWEEVRKSAYIHRKDPFVNMLIGGMALSVNYSALNDETVSFFRNTFPKHLNAVGVYSQKIEEKMRIMSDEELKMILAGKNYNGSETLRNFYQNIHTGERCEAYDSHICQSIQMPENWIYVHKLMQDL